MSVGTLNVTTACSIGNIQRGIAQLRQEFKTIPPTVEEASASIGRVSTRVQYAGKSFAEFQKKAAPFAGDLNSFRSAIVDLSADVDRFDHITKKTAGSGGGLGSLKSALGMVGLGISGAAAVGAVISNVAVSYGRISETGDTAGKIGILTEKLGGLRFAAEQSGSSAGNLDAGLSRLGRGISDAMGDSTSAAGVAVRKLGLNLEYLNSLTPDEQFRAIADAMQGVASPADRAGIAVKLFGSANASLVNTLAIGSSGLDEMQRRAEGLGVALDAVAVARVKEAEDAIGRMGTAWDGAGNQVAVFTSGLVTLVADAIGGDKGLLTGLNQIMGATQEMNEHLRENLEWQAKQQKLEANRAAKVAAEQKITEEYEKQLQTLKDKAALEKDPGAQFDIDARKFGAVRAGNLQVQRDIAEGIAYEKEKKKKADEEAAQKKKEDERKKEQQARDKERAHLQQVRRDNEAIGKLRNRVKDFGKTDLQKDESEMMRTLKDPKLQAEARDQFAKLQEMQTKQDDIDQMKNDRKRLSGRSDDKLLDARTAEGWAALRNSAKDLQIVKMDQQIEIAKQQLQAIKDGKSEEVIKF